MAIKKVLLIFLIICLIPSVLSATITSEDDFESGSITDSEGAFWDTSVLGLTAGGSGQASTDSPINESYSLKITSDGENDNKRWRVDSQDLDPSNLSDGYNFETLVNNSYTDNDAVYTLGGDGYIQLKIQSGDIVANGDDMSTKTLVAGASANTVYRFNIIYDSAGNHTFQVYQNSNGNLLANKSYDAATGDSFSKVALSYYDETNTVETVRFDETSYKISAGSNDNNSPNISYTSSAESDGSTLTRSWALVNVSASDETNLSSVTEQFDGSNSSFTTNQGKYYWTNHTGLSEGTHTFKAYATDDSSNVNSTSKRTITIDAKADNSILDLISPLEDALKTSLSVEHKYNLTIFKNLKNTTLKVDNASKNIPTISNLNDTDKHGTGTDNRLIGDVDEESGNNEVLNPKIEAANGSVHLFYQNRTNTNQFVAEFSNQKIDSSSINKCDTHNPILSSDSIINDVEYNKSNNVWHAFVLDDLDSDNSKEIYYANLTGTDDPCSSNWNIHTSTPAIDNTSGSNFDNDVIYSAAFESTPDGYKAIYTGIDDSDSVTDGAELGVAEESGSGHPLVDMQRIQSTPVISLVSGNSYRNKSVFGSNSLEYFEKSGNYVVGFHAKDSAESSGGYSSDICLTNSTNLIDWEIDSGSDECQNQNSPVDTNFHETRAWESKDGGSVGSYAEVEWPNLENFNNTWYLAYDAWGTRSIGYANVSEWVYDLSGVKKNQTSLNNDSVNSINYTYSNSGYKAFSVKGFQTDGSSVETGTNVFDLDNSSSDTTPPQITIHNPPNSTIASSSTDLNVTTDEKANFSYNVDGGTNTTVDENDQDLNESLSSLSDGSHCANVYAEDSNGNTGYKQRCFTVDTTSPSSSFTFSPSNPNVSETIDFDGSGSSDSTSSIVAYRWDFQNDSTNDATGQTVQTSYNSEGNYSVRLEVEDSAGNIDVSYQTVEVKGQLSVQEKGFVVQACSATPFCITDINSFPNPVKYIDQAIGSSLDDAWKVNATGKAGNSYNVTANFSNTNPYVPDAESNTVTVNLKDSSTNTNSAPSASFTSSTSDLDVSVDGSGSSDSDGSISSYSWDFGDGSTASGSTASHTYSSDGTYTITLTVTDDDGAQDSTSKDVSVSSSSSGGGGGGGSGGDSGGDSGDTVDVNGTKGQLVGPHIESRFLEQTFNVTDGNGTTEIVGGNSHTFTVVDVINDTHADIKVDGNNRTEVEGNEFFLDGNAIRISTILNNSLRKEVAFTEQSFDYSKSDFYLAYTYQINNSGSVELQYRETGPGNSWITAEELSFSTSQNQTFNNYIARDVQNGIYEARVRVNKSGTSEISGPIGFYVGEKTSDIKVTKPNDGATRKVSYTSGNSTNGEYDLDLNYQVYARSNSSINSQSYYYKDGKYYLLNKPNSVSREYSDDDSLLEEFREYLSGSFLEKLGSPFAILFGVQEDSTLNVNTTKIVSGGTGQYVAYANVTSNESVNYNATSIGKRITLVETSPVNTKDRRQKEVKEQSDYEETNDDLHINDSVNKTVNTSSGNKTFEDPYFYPIAPANGAELLTSDKDNFSTKLYFDMAHNGSLTDYNKSVVLLEEGKKVFERKVITKGSQHILEVNSSDVTWEYDKQYKWYGNFTRNSSTLYTTVNKINGTSTFKLSKPGLKELASRWFDPVVGGFTTVYGFGADHVKFWIFLIMTSGIYIISRYKADAFIAKVLGGISYIFFAWFGYVPGIFNLAVVGIAAFIIALKLRRGEVNL